MLLPEESVATYLRDGVLVVDNVLTENEVQNALEGLSQTLLNCYDVDTNNLNRTGIHLIKLSSTGGSGGVLDISYYDEWKLNIIATNPKLFEITKELWKAAYSWKGHNRTTRDQRNSSVDVDNKIPEEYDRVVELHNGNDSDCNSNDDETNFENDWTWHPYGEYNSDIGYLYIDRVGYRLPTELAIRIGSQLDLQKSLSTIDKRAARKRTSSEETTMIEHIVTEKTKSKKKFAIQRSLTPHLDCCPDTFYGGQERKWRPVQCFVSLVDTVLPNHGGFEAAKGFHKDFNKWRRNRSPTVVVTKKKNIVKKKNNARLRSCCNEHIEDGLASNGSDDFKLSNADYDLIVGDCEVIKEIPAPCVGDYTHIRPKEDADVLRKMEHIPVKAGSAVFWDNRIPHANSYRHDGSFPRVVVYCSFLPDVPINRLYVQEQLLKWKQRRPPTDQWINFYREKGGSFEVASTSPNEKNEDYEDKRIEEIRNSLSPLGCCLSGIEPWE